MLFYTITDRASKVGNLFFNFISGLEEDYYLYKNNAKWITVISQETYDNILKYSNNVKNDNTFKRKLTRHRKCLNVIKKIESIEIPYEITLDKTMLVKREYGLWVDDLISSDISNSGFKEIYFTKIRNSKKYIIELKISTSTPDKPGIKIIYGKALSIATNNSLKKAMYNLIKLRCMVRKINIPSINDLDFSLLYLLASKIGFVEDDNPIEARELRYSDLNIRTVVRSKKYTADILKNDLSNTGYKYITLHISRNSLFITLDVKKLKHRQSTSICSDIRELNKDELNSIYKQHLTSLIKTRCELHGITMPKDIDFKTGIIFINTSIVK